MDTESDAARRPRSIPAGIYIHVPFCVAKCQYCDFYSVTALDRIPDYLAALLDEIDRCNLTAPVVDTVYFGGGTPSTLTPRQIERILCRLHACFQVDSAAEITLEVNPGTVDMKRLSGYRSAGVNRLNIGLQSLNDQTLRWLGRIHDARQGVRTFRWAGQSGFDNIGIDLIYGIPGQTEKQWAAELSAAAELGAQHLSCYILTLEPGTPLSLKAEEGRISLPGERVVGELFSSTGEFLSRNGYRHYEVSNFARVSRPDTTDYRSRHNRKYWTFAPYLGFGPAAHSFADNRRWWNTRFLGDYLNAIKSGASPIDEMETLSREQQIVEYIYLSLRQTVGIDTVDFESRFNERFCQSREAEVACLVDEGLIEKSRHAIRPTARGMRFLNHVVERLID